jgi:hypothetical protein
MIRPSQSALAVPDMILKIDAAGRALAIRHLALRHQHHKVTATQHHQVSHKELLGGVDTIHQGRVLAGARQREDSSSSIKTL